MTPSPSLVKTQQETSTCCCPACTGLQHMERPRYFAGQLLTEAELNSEQAYVLAKSRLHNRYLHGSGVVCGLQVACHECEGWVTVNQGYAIDPCGNDLIVCADHDFDVIEAIRQCKEAHRRRRRNDCEPLRPSTAHDCKDVNEYWYLTIAYEEVEARPTTAIRREKTSTCGCCSGNGCRCGCRCHDEYEGRSASTGIATRVRGGVGQTMAACEPTRIREGYRLGVVEGSKDHCCNPEATLADTMLVRVMACIDAMAAVIRDHLTKTEFSAALNVYLNVNESPFDSVNLRTVCCKLKQVVYELSKQNPLNVHCSVFDKLDSIDCPSQIVHGTVQASQNPEKSIEQLMTVLIQYAVDYICQTLLPPCPPDPKDDRLILAGMTISNDKIIDICNFSCRSYAGALPSVSYWLFPVAVIPLIAQAICCRPEEFMLLVGNFSYQRREYTLGDVISLIIYERKEFSIPNSCEDLFHILKGIIERVVMETTDDNSGVPL